MSERVLVCGDRDWQYPEYVWEALDAIHRSRGIRAVIHGGCRGADTYAGEWAKRNGVSCFVFAAEWTKHGRRAGPIRNQQMLDAARPTLVVAFHDSLENSKGTADMVRRARAAGLPVWHFTRAHFTNNTRRDDPW